MQTRTGNFPLGFRRGRGDWQQNLAALLEWTTNNNLEVVDLSADDPTAVKTVHGSTGTYEEPVAPEMVVDTTLISVEDAVEGILRRIEAAGIIPSTG
jgi:hypothetical protein